MSIDWLFDLERMIDSGREVFATPGISRNQWVIGKTVEELKKMAKRSADNRKIGVAIVRLISKHDAIAGDLFLVPTQIGEPGTRGEPQIKWSTVETKEAAEMMRDVRYGPAPYFGLQTEIVVEPEQS